MTNSTSRFVFFVGFIIPAILLSLVLIAYMGQLINSELLYVILGVQMYLLGSVPWGYLVYRMKTGRDIRDYGSGKIGTSNMFRTSGKYIGMLVLLLDSLKGVIAVLITSHLIVDPLVIVVLLLLVVAGHNWSLFLGFKGGRGIAPALGTLLMITTIPAILALLIFLPVTFITKYLSLGSILGVITAVSSICILWFLGWYGSLEAIYACIAGGIILFQHKDNMQRILAGTERKIGEPAEKLTSR